MIITGFLTPLSDILETMIHVEKETNSSVFTCLICPVKRASRYKDLSKND